MAFEPPLSVHTTKVTRLRTELFIPVVHLEGGELAAAHMNSAIRRSVRQMIEDQGSLADPSSQMTAYYEVKTNERGVFSLSLFNYAFTGGAHGLTLQQSLTFMTADGHNRKLASLFKPGSDYRARLSELVAAQIKSRQIELLQPFEGIRADQDYYIADRALVIWFSIYEITPYVYGFPYFPISVYDLSDIVADEGPLSVMNEN
ncbi:MULTISPECIES: DUF3298 and DUF4163 domain-containing protein [Paenibacillus]|uniref:DUF3298 and DUF4163 domain-containing protein n=1 Tax=Paenibacillus TaxID=44249 RepID=UPI00038F55F2|nr:MULTISPECIES: DUF3298 and DUF4163 domain-containing protein [Paenibacillus]KKC46424.1 hypothetical protein VE23_03735 [Paenibacillus sp. D9]